MILISLLLAALVSILPCVENTTSLIKVKSYSSLLNVKSGDTIVLQNTIDLQGETYVIPENVTIISEGCSFKNGCMCGNQTVINVSKNMFDNVKLLGTWLAPVIKTSMFSNTNDDQLFKNISTLQSNTIKNHIYIEKRDYYVSVVSENSYVLALRSNVELELDGKIYLSPNSYKKYSIVKIEKVSNVRIFGQGHIIGDRLSHLDNQGEWGMGISVIESNNVSVADISISDCWGDGIYVSMDSDMVALSDLSIQKCRRQGVSLVGCSNVLINKCLIRGIGGTNPGYGIDLEPNPNKIVKRVTISDTIIENCFGGIQIGASTAKKSSVSDISIKDCDITCTKDCHYSMNIVHVDSLSVINCRIRSVGNGIQFWLCNNVLILDSTLMSDNQDSGIIVKNCKNLVLSNCVIMASRYAFSSLNSVQLKYCHIKCERLSKTPNRPQWFFLNSFSYF